MAQHSVVKLTVMTMKLLYADDSDHAEDGAADNWALRSGGHCPLFVRRERFSIVEHGTFWFSQRPEKPKSVLIGTWLPRIVNWTRLLDSASGRHVTIFNGHLDWWPLAHARSGRIIARQMNRRWDGSPQIVMGDFNAPRQSSTCQELLRHATSDNHPQLHGAWLKAVTKNAPEETFHGGDGQGSFPGRVDHIMFRPQATVKQVVTVTDRQGEVYPSDHFPVLATIQF